MVVHEMTCESVEPPVFSHSNKPQALPTKRIRAKYRDEELATTMSNNIMFDRRVVRGNTYQAQVNLFKFPSATRTLGILYMLVIERLVFNHGLLIFRCLQQILKGRVKGFEKSKR